MKKQPDFQRLALFLASKMTLTEALELAAAEAKTRSTSATLRKIKAKIEQGASLADAVEGTPFGAHQGWIRLGETYGLLEQAFMEIAQGVDPKIRVLSWLEVGLGYVPFPAAFAACAAALPPAERRACEKAKPATLLEAAQKLPRLFPPPMDVALAPDNDEGRRLVLKKAAEHLQWGLWPAKKNASPMEAAFRSLSFLVASGVPLVAGLEAAGLPKARDVVASGGTLSQALAGRVGPGAVAMIKRAEECGNLETALAWIANGLRERSLS